MRALAGLVLMVAAVFACERRSDAQAQNTGTVSGNVLDAQSHFVPNATITLTEVTSHREVTAKSNAKGEYLFRARWMWR